MAAKHLGGTYALKPFSAAELKGKIKAVLGAISWPRRRRSPGLVEPGAGLRRPLDRALPRAALGIELWFAGGTEDDLGPGRLTRCMRKGAGSYFIAKYSSERTWLSSMRL